MIVELALGEVTAPISAARRPWLGRHGAHDWFGENFPGPPATKVAGNFSAVRSNDPKSPYALVDEAHRGCVKTVWTAEQRRPWADERRTGHAFDPRRRSADRPHRLDCPRRHGDRVAARAANGDRGCGAVSLSTSMSPSSDVAISSPAIAQPRSIVEMRPVDPGFAPSSGARDGGE